MTQHLQQSSNVLQQWALNIVFGMLSEISHCLINACHFSLEYNTMLFSEDQFKHMCLCKWGTSCIFCNRSMDDFWGSWIVPQVKNCDFQKCFILKQSCCLTMDKPILSNEAAALFLDIMKHFEFLWDNKMNCGLKSNYTSIFT